MSRSVPSLTLLLIAFALPGCLQSSETSEEVPLGVDPATVDEKDSDRAMPPPLPGAGPVATTTKQQRWYSIHYRRENTLAENGPRTADDIDSFGLDGRQWGDPGKLSVVAFPTANVGFEDHLGLAVRIVNRTGNSVFVGSSDWNQYLVQEAMDGQGNWRAIELMPWSKCGNSKTAHELEADRYWQFPAPRYAGPMPTRLRFRLEPRRGQPIFSNEFAGSIDPRQFDDVPREEKHVPPRELLPPAKRQKGQ